MHNRSRVGEIVLLDFPFTDFRGSKVRPAVIISESHDDFRDLLVAYVTSEVERHIQSKYAIVIDQNDLEVGFVARQSLVRVDKVIVVSEERIYRPGVALLRAAKIEKILRSWAELVVDTHYKATHLPTREAPFVPGESRIPYAGRVYDEREITALVDASLDFWLTAGRYAREFEQKLSEFLGVNYCSLVNSGSSANLLAFMTLTSPKLGERRIKRRDEIITVAACFPTTVAPVFQFGAVPVFVDVELSTGNIDCSQLESAFSEKTKAVMLAHTLGNPFDIKSVKAFCDCHGLWLIEDNCDALGSRYFLDGEWKHTGTLGHLGTCSFYPPHHITMGEGGAVVTDDPILRRLVESFRDWGRDCWCPAGKDNTCGQRFDRQFGELPLGYDHKYVYSHFGYNLKATDMQAAIGVAQMEKLPGFIEARKRNWKLLRDGLSGLSDYLVLPVPSADSDPSWFGFLLTVQENKGFKRDEIVAHLESVGIQTRMLFAGNIIKHPCFDYLRQSKEGYRVVGALENTNKITEQSFWVGVYPGLTEAHLEFMIQTTTQFVKQHG